MLSTLDNSVESLSSVESAKDKPKPLLKDKDLAQVKLKLLVLEKPARDQDLIMLETPKLTAPALTATTPPLLLLTVLPLLQLLLEALPLDLMLIASTAFVLVVTVSVLTVTTPPSLLPTQLPLPPLHHKAPVETSHLAIDSVLDVLITSVLNKPAPLLTAEMPPLHRLTLLDLEDPLLPSQFVATVFLMALHSADNPSHSAPATQSVPALTLSTLTAEMLLLLAHIDFPKLPMTGTVPLLASIEPLPSVLLLSVNRLLMSSLLVSLVTATAILPETTEVFLRSVKPVSNKQPLPLLLLPALATSNTDMLLTPTLVSTAEARLVTESEDMVVPMAVVVPMATVTDMVTVDGE